MFSIVHDGLEARIANVSIETYGSNVQTYEPEVYIHITTSKSYHFIHQYDRLASCSIFDFSNQRCGLIERLRIDLGLPP